MVAMKCLAAFMAIPLALAHPEDTQEAIKREMGLRNVAHAAATRSLSECQGSAQALELRKRSAARRSAKVAELRAQRGLTDAPLSHQKRDLGSLDYYNSLSHNETAEGFSLETPAGTLFGSNNTCALVPETTIGPYYVLGESVRSNITEGETGVPLHIELQFVDMNTCAAVPELLIDVWHCNATGFYSGVPSGSLGYEGGLNTTFLRGAQIADEEGVVAFDSLFPGHYSGRTTHFHLVVQEDPELLPNNTFTGGTTKHIGQLYFDDSLVQAVEATAPYNTNTVAYTTWEYDGWMLEEATTDYDPFVEYVQLSENLADGLLAWITVAVNMTADRKDHVAVAAHYYEGGGVAVVNGSMGDGPSNPCAPEPPNFTTGPCSALSTLSSYTAEATAVATAA
ncbi:hypothetical protein LSUE1_G007944 [Lachnellula suecica]|uniref:Intradiol ring-cleavage dioxygenases domain-containing protein n=1 Tax=Lachnellula suecica TaxID=602035 RepID=A0A8T9C0Z5_9HELO|nr:hypothetical protein LSUE1_G007944 [Lachnellula suecica]